MVDKLLNMKTSITFLEFLDEAKVLAQLVGDKKIDDQKILILSSNPSVRSFLKKQSINTKSTTCYFSVQSHKECSLKLNDILKKIELLIDIEDEGKIKQGYEFSYLYYSQWIISYCLWLIEILHQSIKQNPGIDSIISFEVQETLNNGEFLNDSERFFHNLSIRFAEKNKLSHKSFKNPVNFSPPANYEQINVVQKIKC